MDGGHRTLDAQTNRPNVQGRVYAMNVAQAKQEPYLVKGIPLVALQSASKLFDSEATYLFVSSDYFLRLTSNVKKLLGQSIFVSIPNEESLLSFSSSRRYAVSIKGNVFEATYLFASSDFLRLTGNVKKLLGQSIFVSIPNEESFLSFSVSRCCAVSIKGNVFEADYRLALTWNLQSDFETLEL